MKIPFNNFKIQYAELSNEIGVAVNRVLASGWYLLGAELVSFEQELAAYLGVAHVVGVANGTEALTLGLMALGIGPGDEVIAPALTAYPTVTGITMAGATPVIVDVDLATATMDPAALAGALSANTRAIMPVHLYGRCADMTAITAFAKTHGLAIVEDCAQAIGATHAGRVAGTIGDIGAFSFYPTKNLGAYGDAGAVVTNNDELAVRLRAMRTYGQSRTYCHDLPGINSRLDEIQASILRVKLPYLKAWTARRCALARRYHDELRGVVCLGSAADAGHVHHLFPIRVAERKMLMDSLRAAGIETLIHYPLAVHAQKAFAGRTAGSLANAAQLAEEVVSLPLHPWLTDEEQAAVIAAVNARCGG